VSPGEKAYSVQLHVHGSFSEGLGSIDSHSHEATDVGADVVWWSDHDFRITSYGHVSSFSFDDWREPMPKDGSVLVRRRKQKDRVKELVPDTAHSSGRGGAEIVTTDPREGKGSLRVHATGDGEAFAAQRFAVVADRGLFKRPLAAEVTLELSVFPESLGPDARAFVEVAMSEHAPREGLPLEVYRVRYVMGDPSAQPAREGTTFVVPVPYHAGAWNDLALPVSRDAVRGFPFLHGEDNSLGTIYVGVEARAGAAAAARFDDLRIAQEMSGPQVFARQRALIDAVGKDYPEVRQLQGVEVSWIGRHLNEFSVDTRLVDYDALAKSEAESGGGRERRDRLTRRIVDEIHGRGGLVSYNHMYGAMMEGSAPRSSREEVLDDLVAHEVFGADILEVGYRDRGGHPLEDHLWVWDELAQRGLFVVGTGVSDSHGGPGQRWRTDANNFVSWIYARSPDKADLIEGLRAGRVFFGDLVRFDGTVDLTTARGARMGQIVVTDAPHEDVTVRIEGLVARDHVRLVVSGREEGRWRVASSSFAQTRTVMLDPTQPTVVRVEVDGRDGTAKVLSNPITFVRQEPPGERLGARIVRAGSTSGAATSAR
jgi:hypothetical protein